MRTVIVFVSGVSTGWIVSMFKSSRSIVQEVRENVKERYGI